jgi:hypothetical protein
MGMHQSNRIPANGCRSNPIRHESTAASPCVRARNRYGLSGRDRHLTAYLLAGRKRDISLESGIDREVSLASQWSSRITQLGYAHDSRGNRSRNAMLSMPLGAFESSSLRGGGLKGSKTRRSRGEVVAGSGYQRAAHFTICVNSQSSWQRRGNEWQTARPCSFYRRYLHS